MTVARTGCMIRASKADLPIAEIAAPAGKFCRADIVLPGRNGCLATRAADFRTRLLGAPLADNRR
jgi:hypothetical protein